MCKKLISNYSKLKRPDNAEVSNIKEELVRSEQQAKKKQRELDELNRLTEELKTTITQKHEAIFTLEQRLQKHMEEMSSQFSEAEGLQVLKGEMEESQQRFEEKAEQAEIKNQALQRKIVELTRTLQDKDTNLSDLKQQHAKALGELGQSHQAELTLLKDSTTQEHEQHMKALKQQHVEAMKKASESTLQKGEELTKAEKMLEHRAQEIQSLKSALDDEKEIRKSIEAQKESLEANFGEKEEAAEKASEISSAQMRAKEEEIAKLHAELEELMEENNELEDVQLLLSQEKERRVALEAELEVTQKQLEALNIEKVAFENHLQEAISQKETADSTFEDLMSEKARLQQQKEQLLSQLQSTEMKANEALSDLELVTAEKQTLSEQLQVSEAEAKEKIEHLKKITSEKEAEIQRLTTLHQVSEAEAKETIDRLNKVMVEKEAEIKQLSTSDGHEKKKEQGKRDADEVIQQLKELQEDIKERDRDIANRKAVMEGFKKRLQYLETAKGDQTDRPVDETYIKAKIAALEKEAASREANIKKQHEDALTQLSKAQLEKDALANQFKEAVWREEKIQQQLEDALNQLNNAQLEKDTITNQYKDKLTAFTTLLHDIEVLLLHSEFGAFKELQAEKQQDENAPARTLQNGFKNENEIDQSSNGGSEELGHREEAFEGLLHEHEDLLALLAHQEVEKKALQEMVLKLGGVGAVSRAQSSAKEEVLRRFGCLPFEKEGNDGRH